MKHKNLATAKFIATVNLGHCPKVNKELFLFREKSVQ